MKHKLRIREILKNNPASRNDDKLLTYLVFQEIAKENGQAIFIPFNLFSKFPAFETVKRTRAFIQNVDREFLPEEEIKPIIKNNNIKKEIVVIPDSRLKNSNLI